MCRAPIYYHTVLQVPLSGVGWYLMCPSVLSLFAKIGVSCSAVVPSVAATAAPAPAPAPAASAATSVSSTISIAPYTRVCRYCCCCCHRQSQRQSANVERPSLLLRDARRTPCGVCHQVNSLESVLLSRGTSQLRLRKLASAAAAITTCSSMGCFLRARTPRSAMLCQCALTIGNSFDCELPTAVHPTGIARTCMTARCLCSEL